MKTIVITLCLFLPLIAFSQTNSIISFSEPYKKYDSSKGYIDIEIIAKNLMELENPIIIKITNDGNDTEFLKTFEQTINKQITPIRIFFNPKKLPKNKEVIVLLIEKAFESQNFLIEQKSCTILFSKEESNKSKISLSKIDKVDKIKIDFSKDDKIEIPFIIKSTGKLPSSIDAVSVKVNIKDLKEDLNIENYTIVGSEVERKILISRDSDNTKFSSLLEILEKEEKIELEIAELLKDSKSNIELEKSNESISYIIEKKSIDENRYSFFIGANFDLKDQFKATSYYSEIDAYLPDLINNNWGLRAGIYKNNNSTSLEESRRQEITTEITNITTDSITYSSKRVNTVPNVSIENLGLYFEVLYKLKESTNSNFKIFIAGHFEGIQRREKYTFNSSELFSLGESTISIDSLSNSPKLQALLARPKEFTQKYFDSYFGISFPMMYTNKNKDFEVFLNPLPIGIGGPGLQLVNENKAKTFGLFQFYIAVGLNNSIGIKLGGEMRKYYNYSQDPLVSINLSTKLNLSSIIGPEKK